MKFVRGIFIAVLQIKSVYSTSFMKCVRSSRYMFKLFPQPSYVKLYHFIE